MSELAARLGISKQAVSKRVAELVELGLLELVADPDDGRARRVRFTDFGKQAIFHGLGVLNQLERELAADIGADAMAALRRALLALEPAVERL